ncbi:MAG: hypothetical protein DDT30_02063 [Dehalococcoidia bacterium]|nr:hypothetical protein [Bacillota bacterium]MBT9143092.1 hypothetical protein [Bacillota bacterium]
MATLSPRRYAALVASLASWIFRIPAAVVFACSARVLARSRSPGVSARMLGASALSACERRASASAISSPSALAASIASVASSMMVAIRASSDATSISVTISVTMSMAIISTTAIPDRIGVRLFMIKTSLKIPGASAYSFPRRQLLRFQACPELVEGFRGSRLRVQGSRFQVAGSRLENDQD